MGPKALIDIQAQLGKLRLVPGAQALVRFSEENSRSVAVRNGRQQPLSMWRSGGVMFTVYFRGAAAYSATPDMSPAGLDLALGQATALAARLSEQGQLLGTQPRLSQIGDFKVPVAVAHALQPDLKQALECLMLEDVGAISKSTSNEHIVEREGSIAFTRLSKRLFLLDASRPGRVDCLSDQEQQFCVPHWQVTALVGGISQTRTLAGAYNGFCQQGLWEVVERSGLIGAGSRLAAQAIALAKAPQCPSGAMDLLLAPDQMLLQIHESIGHPLELDRILGDERNFAGGSFVTPQMFGEYQYGSEKLNVSVGPQIEHEFASYTHDDEGLPSKPMRLIEAGKLLRPLGGDRSNQRAAALGVSFDAVACSRASAWDRPAIDRMPNLNVEPGVDSLSSMIASCRRGVYMQTNVSWSIDDRRDKFQFGCEYAQLIENGELTTVVRNPNYRGRSATFWRNLASVGEPSTVQVMGTPFCGKGEPGQVIRVGHASPACLFNEVQVFGGEQ